MSVRGSRRVLLAGALLIVGAMGVLPTAGADGDPGVAEAAERRAELGFSTSKERIRELADHPDANRDWGLPLTKAEASEMERRGEINDHAVRVEAHADDHPARFGELWIDQPGGGILVVEVTDKADASDREAVRAMLPDDVEVRFDEVERSRGELRGAMDDLARSMIADDDAIRGITGVGIRIGTNQLEVSVVPGRKDEIRASLDGRGDGRLFRVVDGAYDENAACTDRENCWADPLRGGIEILPDGCTTGFIVYDTSSSWERLLTAGHCLQGDLGNMRYHDGTGHHLGTGLSEKYYSGSFGDFGLLRMDEHQGMAGHTVYYNSTDKNHSIDGTRDVLNGASVCRNAVITGRTCDDVIIQPYLSNGTDGVALTYQKVVDFESEHGASGAAMTNGDKATGILSRLRGDTTVFSGIEYLVFDYYDYEVCIAGGSSEC